MQQVPMKILYMYSASKPVAAYSMRIINCLDKMSSVSSQHIDCYPLPQQNPTRRPTTPTIYDRYVADRDEKQKMLQMRVSRTVEVWWSPEHTCVFGNERARCFSYLCKKGDGHRWHHGLQTRGKVYRFTRAHSQKHPQKVCFGSRCRNRDFNDRGCLRDRSLRRSVTSLFFDIKQGRRCHWR